MIATTKKQSDRLLKAGLGKDTADMGLVDISGYWTAYDMPYKNMLSITPNYSMRLAPAWSLTALIDLMPAEIGVYSLEITKFIDFRGNKRTYSFAYEEKSTLSVLQGSDFSSTQPFTAAVNMVLWLIKKGYIECR